MTTKYHGLVVIQPHSWLYEQHRLTCTNGVATTERDIPFRVLIANFSDVPKRVVRNQTIAAAMLHPAFIVPTHIRTAEVLGIVLYDPVCDSAAPPNGDGTSRYESGAGEVTPSAADIELSHVPQAFRDPLRKMITRYDSMWDGRLGEVNVVKHRIDLAPGARPHMKRPSRTGPASRKFVSDEIVRMLEHGIIEPAQSEWASPVWLLPNPTALCAFASIIGILTL